MNAYVSYICNDAYLPGVIALIKSLKYNQCKSDILIMVTKDVSLNSKDIIFKLGAFINDIEEINYKGNNAHKIKDRYGKTNESWKMFTKLNIWKLCKYEKILYIDADTITLQNVDHLFDTNARFSAVMGGSKILKYYGIEGGVLLIEPSLDTYKNLIDAMNDDTDNLIMSDQSLINDYFSKRGEITVLDKRYNVLQKKNKHTKDAFIYHWNGVKPWNDRNISNFKIWNFFYEL
tara:strand:+ start:7494 stop:8192 length:699 start_codon:yes stop_codon:yes gene_type:complete